MKRSRFLVLLASCLIGVSCSDSPLGSEPRVIEVDGLTASFRQTNVRLARFNLSWFPPDDSPRPALDNVFATFLFEVTNRSDEPRAISSDQFLLRTLNDQFREGPIMAVHPVGRTPLLDARTLLPGETIEGWLTYSIPRGFLPDKLLWTPEEDLAFAIEVPFLGPGRIEEALVFGRVTDASGTPLPNTLLTITPVETVPGIPGTISDLGDCRGTPYSALESLTDESGWYRATVISNNADEFCIDVHRASDTETRAAGAVRPGQPTELAETPQVRIDLVVQE